MTAASGTSSGEQFAEVGRGITLCYERLGQPDGEPLLLIAGLGQQLHTWPDGLCSALVQRGFSVVRFDNRDVGRSTHSTFRPPAPLSILRGRTGPHQYNLADLARDAVGLLDQLGWADAHVVGASMGGMIAQTLAAHEPDRVRTLTSIMSNTGARRAGRPALSTYLRMAGRPPRERERSAERTVRFFRHIGSQGLPQDEAWVREAALTAWDRDPTSDGTLRQLAAIVSSGDRTRELAHINAPTLVIHGDRDRMVHPSGAAATVRAIPGARLVTIKGMGHDLPSCAWPEVVGHITDHTRRNDDASITA